MVTSRVGLSAAVPMMGLLALVSTAALPDPQAAPAPAPVTSTTTTVPSTTTTTEPPLEPGDEAASVVRRGDQLEVTLATDVLFEFNSATLAPEAVARLTALAPRLARSATPGVVTIVGHTDSIGSEAANQALSEARALAVPRRDRRRPPRPAVPGVRPALGVVPSADLVDGSDAGGAVDGSAGRAHQGAANVISTRRLRVQRRLPGVPRVDRGGAAVGRWRVSRRRRRSGGLGQKLPVTTRLLVLRCE